MGLYLDIEKKKSEEFLKLINYKKICAYLDKYVFMIGIQNDVLFGYYEYRVSHIEMVETKWLWGVVELRILIKYGI